MLSNRSVKLLAIYITLCIPLCNIFIKKENYHKFQFCRAVTNFFCNVILTLQEHYITPLSISPDGPVLIWQSQNKYGYQICNIHHSDIKLKNIQTVLKNVDSTSPSQRGSGVPSTTKGWGSCNPVVAEDLHPHPP